MKKASKKGQGNHHRIDCWICNILNYAKKWYLRINMINLLSLVDWKAPGEDTWGVCFVMK